MRISFHGADQGVTGSCHLIECAGKRMLIDCGMYQGGRELDEDNADPFGFEPAAIDFLLLTHAHLDHCGRVPLLVERGFCGEIIATAATRELARVVMLDAAHLHEDRAEHRKRQHARRGPAGATEPLYTTLDALNALDRFGRAADYGRRLELAPGIHATFMDAGHILGSASVFLELEEHGEHRTVALSGDLGDAGRPLLRAPQPPPKCDIVVIETFYGDRRHRPVQAWVEELTTRSRTLFDAAATSYPDVRAGARPGLLFYLREGVAGGQLPRSVQVFLDSPMAISATRIFQRHPECFDADIRELFREGRDPLALPGLHFVRTSEESMAINRLTGGVVIMAGSGMCTGGCVRHHLRRNLWREEASVVFVGFAARGTLARSIVDGASHVQLFGEEVRVRAAIHTINGFSAHADEAELLAWHRALRPARTFL